MLTEKEKELVLKRLEEDLRQYVTEEEWKEYIPKLIKRFRYVPPKSKLPNDYIAKYFIWKDSVEGEAYWRDWSNKISKRFWFGDLTNQI
jgi:hypothetical protein